MSTLYFSSLAWDPLLSSGSKFSKKQNQQLGATLFHAKLLSVLGLLMFPKDLSLPGYMKVHCCGSDKCPFRHIPGPAFCTKPSGILECIRLKSK